MKKFLVFILSIGVLYSNNVVEEISLNPFKNSKKICNGESKA